jgi:hypothetical protein
MFIVHLLEHNLLFHNRLYNTHQRILKRLLRPTRLPTHHPTPSLHNLLRFKRFTTTKQPPTPSFDSSTNPIFPKNNCPLPTPLKIQNYILMAWFLPCPLLLSHWLLHPLPTHPPTPSSHNLIRNCLKPSFAILKSSKSEPPHKHRKTYFNSRHLTVAPPVLFWKPQDTLYGSRFRCCFPREGVG